MTLVSSTDSERLHVIVCIVFDRRAVPDEIEAFKGRVIACPMILHALELTGSFDFMVEAVVPNMATFDEQMKLIAGPVAALVSSYDVSFICKCFDRNEETSEPIWVDCDGGMKRIAASSVDKVTAEGDYMRVHSNGHGWMVHATMRSIVERLPSREFVKVHRSTLVRCNFIDRLVLEDGRWVAWLEDGSRENVARSQVKETFRIIRSNPAIPTVDSSKGESIHLD